MEDVQRAQERTSSQPACYVTLNVTTHPVRACHATGWVALNRSLGCELR
uniref:Uncharacterized protein n=1 Tax=Thermogemmatispora argillosa TaxID=2045280 RepID=A0A455T0E5_9CHLR|nr:hypothetical protein KTA_00740 [Thermogemmatispora argillosa]